SPIAGSQPVASLEESGDVRAGEATSSALGIALISGVAAGLLGALAWDLFARLVRLTDTSAVALVAVAIATAVFANAVINVLLAKLRMRAASTLVLAQPAAVAVGLAADTLGASLGPSTLAAAGFAAVGLGAVVWTIAERA